MLEGYGITSIYGMKYGQLSFSINKESKYENISYSSSMLDLVIPKIKLTQNAQDNIVRKGDKLLLSKSCNPNIYIHLILLY